MADVKSALKSAERYEAWQRNYDAGKGSPIDRAQSEVLVLAAKVKELEQALASARGDAAHWAKEHDLVAQKRTELAAEVERLKHDSATSLEAAGNIARDRIKDGRFVQHLQDELLKARTGELRAQRGESDQRALVEHLISGVDVRVSTSCAVCELQNDGTGCMHPEASQIDMNMEASAPPDNCPLRKGPLLIQLRTS